MGSSLKSGGTDFCHHSAACIRPSLNLYQYQGSLPKYFVGGGDFLLFFCCCKSSNPLPIFPFITGEESGLCLFVCYCYCSARYCYRFPHSLDTGLLIGLASIHDKAERGECLFCQKIHSGRYHLTVIPTMYTGKQMKHLKYKDRKI